MKFSGWQHFAGGQCVVHQRNRFVQRHGKNERLVSTLTRSLKEQPSEITVTLLTEPDTNTNAEGESAAVDVQLVYMTDDSKLQAADYDQIASTPLPDVLGKNYIDHQDFNLLPDN